MPIPLPDIDDRTWADLVDELRARLPRTAAGWTDHNLSDPGITLLELFAWVGEQLMYRADRVPAATRRAFLRQFGIEPRPPAVAGTVVALRLPAAAAPFRLPAGRPVTDRSGQVRFSTSVAVDLSASWLELDPAEPSDRGLLTARGSGRVADVTQANRLPDGAFHPFGPAPRDGDTFEIAFDVPPAPPGTRARLHVWTETWPEDAELATALVAAGPEPWRHPGIATVWEYWVGAAGWRAVPRVRDATRGLTLSGPVTVAGLVGHVPGPGDGRYRLRCRIVAGAAEYRPRLHRIAVNAVPVEHGEVVLGGVVATSRGEPLLSVELARPPRLPEPVRAGSLRLTVHGSGRWREVLDWDRSGPFDRHVRLDPERGVVEFGDGRRGLVPPAGATVTACRYRTGGGPAGNVPTGTLTRLDQVPGVVVAQPEDTGGGAPAEGLAAAQGRLLDRLATSRRGVTLADLEALAVGSPGMAVRRARAVSGRHPGYPELAVPGSVTLVVLTANGTASDAVVRAVEERLDPWRPLGCELHVTAPGWREIAVRATLRTARTRGAADLAATAAAALDAFLDPVSGGPDGMGWPFGRDIHRTEVAAVLADVPGVDTVEDLELRERWSAGPTCAAVRLCPTDLVRPLTHDLQIRED